MPSATAAADPPLDPPADRVGSCGFFTGPNAERAKKLATTYNETCYHQPCDEFSDDWDLSGAVEDLQLLADLGWRIAEAKQMPRYNPDEQFARPRSGTTGPSSR